MDKFIKIEKDRAVINVKTKIYSKEAVFAAGYIFLDKAYMILDQEKDNIKVHIYPVKKTADLKKLAFEFYNELLNYSHYFYRVKANASAVKAVMQRALFSAAPSLVEESQDNEIKKLIEELEKEEKNERKNARSK